MKKYLALFLFVFLSSIPQYNFGQEKKPKVVLVLSGGGAKGIAHIPLLQKLDSLHIVPDLIIGTSMGSIVGGLYAMGYSGDSIANLAKSVEWSEILGGGISLKDVSIGEKREYKRYLVDFDLVKGKPKMSSSVINDQNIRELFSMLTYPVVTVNNFDDLSIPYRAMTVDIVNGKEFLLEDGSLAKAMRASMSIPGIFEPVDHKNTLLVDGGVLNNFPVDVARKMGADFVIGSDVGGGMQKREKLDNIVGLAFQTGMVGSNLKNPISRADCDILVDHMPNLTHSSGDFEKAKAIYNEGVKGTKSKLDELIKLAEKLNKFEQREHKLPVVKDKFKLDTIIYKNISKGNLQLTKSRAKINTDEKYTAIDVIDGVNRAMGTTLFKEIWFDGFKNDETTGLVLTAREHSKNQVKGSLHYDTSRGVGLILNYTGRNLIGESSRLIVTLDVAEQPKFEVEYQKLFGKTKQWWWRFDAVGENLKQDIYRSGEVAEKVKHNFYNLDTQLNFNTNSLRSFLGIGLLYRNTKIVPTINPEINDNFLALEDYYLDHLELYGQFVYSNMNKVFFPTQGTNFKARFGRALDNGVKANFYDGDLESVEGKITSFSKLSVDFETRFPMNRSISGIVGFNSGFSFEDALSGNDVSFKDYGYAAKYFIGGYKNSNTRHNSAVFPGLHEDELNVSQFMALNLGVQFNVVKDLYVTPHGSIASVGFDEFNDYIGKAFTAKGEWDEMFETSALMSAGAMIQYDSFLGPVRLDFSWVNQIKKVRVYFGVGLFF